MNAAVLSLRTGPDAGPAFEVAAGCGLVVSSGSGAVLDAVLALAFGLERAAEARLAGRPLTGIRERVLLERLGAVGYAAGEGGLIGNLKLWENLLLPRDARRRPPAPVPVAELEQEVVDAFAVAGLGEARVLAMMPRTPDRLSAFERILSSLVRCHLWGFDVLLCDRIFDGLDADRSRRVAAMVDWIGGQRPRSALLVLHHSRRPARDRFGLNAWNPIDLMTLEDESWPAS